MLKSTKKMPNELKELCKRALQVRSLIHKDKVKLDHQHSAFIVFMNHLTPLYKHFYLLV